VIKAGDSHRLSSIRELEFLINEIGTFVSAFGHLVSPHAHPGFTVIGQSGAALVAGRLAVPAVPEDIALFLIREDAVQTGAMRCADG